MAGIKKITAILFILRVVGMLISIISVTITAKFFGVSADKDCWVLALAVTTTILQAVWGPLNEIFRAKFVFIRENEGFEKALSMTSSLIGFIFTVTILLGIMLLLFSQEISTYIIGNIPPESSSTFYVLLVAMIPTLLLTELTRISSSILNAFDIFYIPEIVGFFTSTLHIFLILILAPVMGIYSLVVSTYISTFTLLIVDIYYLQKNSINIWGKLFKFKWCEASPFLLFALPFFFPYFVGQINGLSEKYIAGLLGQGAISSLDYANQFTKILQSVLSGVLTTVMVPMLAKAFSNNETSEFSSIMKENMKVCMLIMIGVCGFLIGAAEPLCRFFFFRGKVSIEQLDVIIALTRAYGLFFIGIFLYIVFGCAMLSSNRGKLYASIGVFTQILVTVLYIIGYTFINSLYVFPISAGVAHFIAAVIMMYYTNEVRSWMLIRYIALGFTILLTISVLVYILNMFLYSELAIIQLILNGVIVVVLMVIATLPLGYDMKPIVKQILKKYIKR